MRISVILAHPDKKSLNHAIAEIAVEALKRNGHEVHFHDLYDEKFDPVLAGEEIPKRCLPPPDISGHCREIAAADGIVIIHPNWWGKPPAIMAGWVDRVLRPGVAYEFLENDTGEGVPNGLLKARSAIVFNTSNTGPQREQDVFGDPLEAMWKNCIFDLCGVKTVHRRTFNIVVTSTEAHRKAWLDEVAHTIDTRYPKRT